MIIIPILVLYSIRCNQNDTIEEKQVSKQLFKMIPLEKSKNQIQIDALGSVSHFNKAEITPKVVGRIEKIYKEEGDRITRNTALAKIETIDLEIQLRKDLASLEVQKQQIKLSEAKYIQAKQRVEKELAAIEKARADYDDSLATYNNMKRTADNKKELYEVGAVSETELKGVETALESMKASYIKANKSLMSVQIGYRKEDLKSAGFPIPKKETDLKEAFVKLNTIVEKSELDIAKANLKTITASIESTRLLIEESTVRSPINGIIAARTIFPGEFAKQGEPIFVVVDDSYVLLKFAINETDLGRIQENQEVSFHVDAFKNKTFKGKVLIISPIVDPQTRTAEVKVIYKKDRENLRPGMFARAKISDLNPESVFLIPTGSILSGKEKDEGFIFVEKNKLLFKQRIKIEGVTDNNTIISGELSEGQMIAIGNIKNISEGEEIPNE